MMKIEYLFPVTLMLLDIGAGVVYLAQKNWNMFLYWVLQAGLTATVTFK